MNLRHLAGTGDILPVGDVTCSDFSLYRGKLAKSAQEKLADMQQKLQNKNLSNKKRKELKKQERKMRGDEKKRSPRPETNGTNDDSDLVVANVQALTI